METTENINNMNLDQADPDAWRGESFQKGAIIGAGICLLFGALLGSNAILLVSSGEMNLSDCIGWVIGFVIVAPLLTCFAGTCALWGAESDRDAITPVMIKDKHNRKYAIRFQNGWTKLRDHLAESVSGDTAGWRVLTADTRQGRIVAVTEQVVKAPIDSSVNHGQLEAYGKSIGRHIYQAVVNMRIQVEIQMVPVGDGTQFVFNWQMRQGDRDFGGYASQEYVQLLFWTTFDRFYAELDNIFGQPELVYYVKEKGKVQPWEATV